MEKFSNPEENDDPNDQSASETPVYSTMSTDSFAYHGTCSETSAGFSDETSSFCSEVSPCHWPLLTESKSETKTNHIDEPVENLSVQEISEPGFVSLSLSVSMCVCLYFLSVRILKLHVLGSVLCRIGDDEGKILEASAWRRHVRKRQRRLHRCDNLKRHNQSLW